MKIDFDYDTWTPVVTLSEADLKRAFSSEEEFYKLRHEIVRRCYGDYLADLLYPKEGDK